MGSGSLQELYCGVFLGEELVGEGEGSSKQEAEVSAAKAALEKKNW